MVDHPVSGFFVPTHVLDPLMLARIDELLADLKKQVGDVAIDLSQLDGHWVDFRADVRSLTAADSPLLQESANRTDEGSSGIVLYDPNAPSFDDFATFRQAASDHGASESSAWSDFTKKASKTEKELPGFLDYLASLIPRGLLEGGKRAVEILIETLRSALERVLGFLREPSRRLWDVLRNPDDFYLRLRGSVVEFDRRFGERGGQLAEALMFVPDLASLYIRLLYDDRVSSRAKLDLARSLAYLILPLDAFPEAFLGPIGYTDDLLVLTMCMTKLIHRKYVSEELLEEHWSGSVAALEWLQRLLDSVELPALREKLFGLVCGAERS